MQYTESVFKKYFKDNSIHTDPSLYKNRQSVMIMNKEATHTIRTVVYEKYYVVMILSLDNPYFYSDIEKIFDYVGTKESNITILNHFYIYIGELVLFIFCIGIKKKLEKGIHLKERRKTWKEEHKRKRAERNRRFAEKQKRVNVERFNHNASFRQSLMVRTKDFAFAKYDRKKKEIKENIENLERELKERKYELEYGHWITHHNIDVNEVLGKVRIADVECEYKDIKGSYVTQSSQTYSEPVSFGKICQGHKQIFFDKFTSSLFLS